MFKILLNNIITKITLPVWYSWNYK